MYKIYFSDKIISVERGTPSDDQTIERANLLQKIQNTKHLTLFGDDPGALYEAVISQFPSIEAGGGLVTGAGGKILMIFRHNRWDLPKGKLEPGEAIDACALREVREETGVTGLTPGKKLLVTTHGYRLNGEWMLKKTTWYAMSHAGSEALVPQTEEDITAIEWVDPAKLDSYLHTTYSTVIDVFEAAGYRIR